MDVLSAFLAIFEKGTQHASRLGDMKREASRLNAEAGAEAGRCVDILNLATLRMKNKCQLLAPDNPEVWADIEKGLLAIRRDVDNAVEMCAKCQGAIDQADSHKIPKVMTQITTMHATSKRMVPWVQGVMDHYDSILDNAHRYPA